MDQWALRGIALRLGITFCAVVLLAVATDLLAAREPTGTESAIVFAAQPGTVDAQRNATVTAAVSGYDRAVETAVQSPEQHARQNVERAGVNLQRRINAYIETAGSQSFPRLNELAQSTLRHVRSGSELVASAGRRAALEAQLGATLASIVDRVDAGAHQGWRLMGRVVARRSMLDLYQAMEDVRVCSEHLLAARSPDSSALDALDASITRFAARLVADSDEFTRVQGPNWTRQMRADITRIRVLGHQLAALDLGRFPALVDFRSGGVTLAAGIYAPPSTAVAAPESTAVMPREARLSGTGRFLLVLSALALASILVVAVRTIVGVHRPVRRFIDAMSLLARGNSQTRLPHGRFRELNALAVAFNHMAERIGAHQKQLESLASESTNQLRHREVHDPLTELPNRGQLLKHLETALERARRMQARVVVLFIDLDNFRTINDGVGHEFGDQVLVRIAERISNVAGPTAFVSRTGGDEFVVVHDAADGDSDPDGVGRQLLDSFAPSLNVEQRELSVSISVGAAIYPDHAGSADALLRAADAAVFQAKASGRSRLCLFDPALLEEASTRFRIAQELKCAIHRNELELVFQPEVSAETMTVSALEALVRWRKPDGTLEPPGQFLGIAEETGLIRDIGDWVIWRAIGFAARWHRLWPDVRVAINVTAPQLLEAGFVRRTTDLLAQYGLPAACIELELTEGALQTGAATIKVLEELRAAGIPVALDDFGTGYSSLASLEQLPLSRVKLDRSLIAGIHTSTRSRAIAKSITGLCRRLGLQVTAEGIEHMRQLSQLTHEKAMHLQGFLIARPVRSAQVPSVVTAIPKHMASLLNAPVSEWRTADAVGS